MRNVDGSEHPFKGEYLEIIAPEKLTYSLIYDVDYVRDMPCTETVELAEKEGKTLMIFNIRHLTKEARDGHLQYGMEQGAAMAFDRLESLLSTLSGR